MQNNQNNQNIINGFDFDSLPINISYCGKVIEDKGGWNHFLYSVSIGTDSNMFTTQYKYGLGHSQLDPVAALRNPPPMNCKKDSPRYLHWISTVLKPTKPKNSDIMYSLLMDSEAGNYSFQDFCDNFGYSSDSIKDFSIYQECKKTSKNLRKVFTNEQLQQMQEALQDY